MSTFRHPIALGSPDGSRFEEIEALVYTGSSPSIPLRTSYTWVPRSLLERLGVQPSFRREFETADGRVIERDMNVTMARLDGQLLPILVVFGDEQTIPLMGAQTLETFGLAPDPLGHRLIPVRGLLMTLLL